MDELITIISSSVIFPVFASSIFNFKNLWVARKVQIEVITILKISIDANKVIIKKISFNKFKSWYKFSI